MHEIKVKIQHILIDVERVREKHVSATLHAELSRVERQCKELITEFRDVDERTETVLINPPRETNRRITEAVEPDQTG